MNVNVDMDGNLSYTNHWQKPSIAVHHTTLCTVGHLRPDHCDLSIGLLSCVAPFANIALKCTDVRSHMLDE